MHKKTLAAVIACILGIVLLAGLAFLIISMQSGSGNLTGGFLHPESMQSAGESELFTGFIFSTEEAEEETAPSLPDTKPAQTEPEDIGETETDLKGDKAAGTAETLWDKTAAGTVTKEHHIIFVGDSRTLGMRDALRRFRREDDDVFVGKVGEGVRWFREEGMEEMARAIEENPDLPVVLNLGVNDPTEIGDYIVTYWDCEREHPGTRFYVLSVNPIDEEFLIDNETVDETVLETVNNLNIAKLNIRLKEEFSDRYLDSSSFLRSEGFDTVDGLHFSAETYLKIHDFVVNELF